MWHCSKPQHFREEVGVDGSDGSKHVTAVCVPFPMSVFHWSQFLSTMTTLFLNPNRVVHRLTINFPQPGSFHNPKQIVPMPKPNHTFTITVPDQETLIWLIFGHSHKQCILTFNLDNLYLKLWVCISWYIYIFFQWNGSLTVKAMTWKVQTHWKLLWRRLWSLRYFVDLQVNIPSWWF